MSISTRPSQLTPRRIKKTINAWFSDTILIRLFKNAGWLLGGDALASVMRMVTVALMARALGVEDFGILVVIQTFVGIVDRVVNFQSWQALIKFSAEHQAEQRQWRLEDLFKFGLCVDFCTAILGAIIAVSVAPLIGGWLGWDSAMVGYAALYGLVIMFNLEGTSIAILRCYDKFRLLGAHKVITAAIKLAATVVAFTITSSLTVFIAVSAVSQLIGYLLLLAFAFRQLGEVNLQPIRRGFVIRAYRENMGIGTYIITTNIHATFRMLPDLFDLLIVNAVLGNAATGIYKVAKELGRVLTRFVQPLYQSIYPEFTRLAVKKQYRSILKIVYKSSAVVGFAALGFWVGIIVFGQVAVSLVFGGEYVGAYPVLLWYAFGAVLSAAAFPITPAILALGLPKLPLLVIIGSTLVYMACLPILMMQFGLVGAGMAYVVFYGSWILLMGLVFMFLFIPEGRKWRA